MQLAAPAGLGLTVDLDDPLGEQALGLRAAADQSGQLEELAQADRLAANRQVAHGADGIRIACGSLRLEYRPAVPDFEPLREQDAATDPFEQFARWFAEAGQTDIRLPEAAALATSGADGAPSLRMVLVKHTGRPGFVFYSNHSSRKGRALEENPRAALLFYWDALGRQVRLEGPVQRMSVEESAEYVASRPRGSQLSALASHQSRPVSDRAELERRVQELSDRYAGRDQPVPDFWGGYRLTPESFEFWQHRDDRLHDRLLYTPHGAAGWRVQRLAP